MTARMVVAARATGPKILALDSFDRADSTTGLGAAETGQVWTDTGYGIINNMAYRPSLSDSVPTVVDAGAADVAVSVDVTFLSGLSAGLVIRCLGINDFLYVGLISDTVELRRVQAGAWTTIASKLIGALTTGVPYRLRAVAVGSTVEVSVDGTLHLTATESFQAGQTFHGIVGMANNNPRFDNFRVDPK